MIKREEGFTLVELMITMVVFVLVIAAASSIFSSLLNQFKQQSKIIESNVEGLVGLEMMRVDIQEAGFGLPWNVDSNNDGVADASDWTIDSYYEASEGDNTDPTTPMFYNDGDTPSAIPAPATQRAPRALLAHNDAGPEFGTGYRSDYLVVKSTCVSLNTAAQKWTSITNNGGANLPAPTLLDPNGQPIDELKDNDRVIVERAVMRGTEKVLIMPSTNSFSTQFSVVKAPNSPWQPDLGSFETHFIYGVDANNNPRAPFNRADFYVATPANMPTKCAPNTGILYKALMNRDGTFQRLPLLDCVADMQVVFLTADPDDPANKPPLLSDANFTDGLTAQQIRDQVRGVVVYILAQEGQRDPNFTFNNFSTGCGVAKCMRVGGFDVDGVFFGREFDLSSIGPGFVNYRWKVYQFAVYPPNLR